MLGVTPSRICHLVNSRIKRAVEAAHVVDQVADLYADDPEYSKLIVDWIAI